MGDPLPKDTFLVMSPFNEEGLCCFAIVGQ